MVEDYQIEGNKQGSFQSETELEKNFIELLKNQSYEYLTINNEKGLIDNLRRQVEKLNDYKFTDNE